MSYCVLFLLEEKIATNPKFNNAIINDIWPICFRRG